jgi:peptidoglycan/LPS O-acetylase OafA/YrhL
VLLVVSYVIASVVPEIYGQRAICIIPIALLIAAAAIADADGRFTLFRNRVMIWLGNISFAFYLLHYIVLAYSRKLLGTQLFSTPVGIGLLIADIGITILLAWALYALFELPITRRWSRPRIRPKPPASATR